MPAVPGDLRAALPAGALEGRGLVFSFFSGGGFLDLGFEDEGFCTLMADELHEPFRRAYLHGRRSVGLEAPPLGVLDRSVEDFRRGEPRKWLRERVTEARALGLPVGFIGGPPCPDFSMMGRHAGKDGRHGRLTRIFIDLICDMQPDFFAFENVKGLLRVHRAHLLEVEARLASVGYRFSRRLADALEYGVPQSRERVLIVGFHPRLHAPGQLPRRRRLPDQLWDSHLAYDLADVRARPWPVSEPFEPGMARACPDGIIAELTVEHWFRRNAVETHPNAAHRPRVFRGERKMRSIAEGDTSGKSFKRLHRWRYAATAAYGRGELHLHPWEPRRISVAETLAVQSMPAAFELPADISRSDASRVVGNGVPYLMARGIARTIAAHVEAVGGLAGPLPQTAD